MTTAMLASTRTPPGPPSVPLLGWRANVLPVLVDPAVQMLKMHRAYGDLVALARGTTSFIFIFSPEYNREVLTDQFLFYSLNTQDPASPVRFRDDSSPARLFSGIAGMNGEKHVQQRRMMMPAFHRKAVDGYRDTMVACIEARLSRWRSGQAINLKREMKDLTLGVAIGALIGLDPEREGNRIRDLLERWGVAALSIPVELFPFNAPGFPYRRFLRMSDQLEAEFQDVISRKRAALTLGDEVPRDVLSLLIQARDEDGTRLTDVELLGHLTTLFTAGHETTASALTWTLFLLSQHPDTMADLLDELESHLHGEPPTVEQIRDLPLLDHVIDESMRLFPPAIWFLRISSGPFTLGGHDFPKGTRIVVSPAVAHRREEVYSQPARFLPRRWETINPSLYEFMPFGAGPRRCIGATFAVMEMKLALSLILQRFRISLPEGARVDRSGTILSFPRGGLPVVLHAQDRQFGRSRVRGNVHAWLDLP